MTIFTYYLLGKISGGRIADALERYTQRYLENVAAAKIHHSAGKLLQLKEALANTDVTFVPAPCPMQSQDPETCAILESRTKAATEKLAGQQKARARSVRRELTKRIGRLEYSVHRWERRCDKRYHAYTLAVSKRRGGDFAKDVNFCSDAFIKFKTEIGV